MPRPIPAESAGDQGDLAGQVEEPRNWNTAFTHGHHLTKYARDLGIEFLFVIRSSDASTSAA